MNSTVHHKELLVPDLEGEGESEYDGTHSDNINL